MATADRERNNARKAAAREYQRKHPGVRYKAALNQIANDGAAPPGSTDDRAGIATLLGISSVDDVLARYQATANDAHHHQPDPWWRGYDGHVPLGFTDDGELVSINIGPGRTLGGVGTHGAIRSGGGASEHELAALIATVLRAKNAPESLQVVYVDPGNTTRTHNVGDVEFRGRDARDRFAEWLEHELRRRWELAANANARDIGQLRELMHLGAADRRDAETTPRVLVVAVDSPVGHENSTGSKRWRQMLNDLAAMGRANDMFLLLVCPPHSPSPVLQHIRDNIGYRVAMKGGSWPSRLFDFDDLLIDAAGGRYNREIPDDAAVLGIGGETIKQFTMLQFDSQLLENVNQARNHLHNKMISEFSESVAKWGEQTANFEDHLDQIAAEPQPQADPYVTARVDKGGVLTKLTIDTRAATEYTADELGEVVTQSLQAVFDDVDKKVRKAYDGKLLEPDRAAEPRIIIKATHITGLTTIAVDRWCRPLYCNIEPNAITWGAEVLGLRITRLCRAAQERVRQQIVTHATSNDLDDVSSWITGKDIHPHHEPDVRVSIDVDTSSGDQE